jgi:hypothetical protein
MMASHDHDSTLKGAINAHEWYEGMPLAYYGKGITSWILAVSIRTEPSWFERISGKITRRPLPSAGTKNKKGRLPMADGPSFVYFALVDN